MWEEGSRYLGLLYYAQPRPPDCRAGKQGSSAFSHWRGASQVHKNGELPARLAGPPLAGTICFLRDAGKIPFGLHSLYRDESGTIGSRGPPEQWCWSSAPAHMARKDDSLVNVLPLLDMVGEDWKDFLLKAELDRHGQETLRRHERTGRPLGDTAFIEMLEQETGRRLRPKKSGPNPARRK